MAPSTLAAIRDGDVPKGDVLAAARIAGIMAAKRTPELIPLCHTLLLSKVAVEFEIDEAASRVVITATVRCKGQTGVEMEALTAVSVAALTIYDMAKALEKGMEIRRVSLKYRNRKDQPDEWEAAKLREWAAASVPAKEVAETVTESSSRMSYSSGLQGA